jgi:hypothetical protein
VLDETIEMSRKVTCITVFMMSLQETHPSHTRFDVFTATKIEIVSFCVVRFSEDGDSMVLRNAGALPHPSFHLSYCS